jgi:hypothetical protein
LAGNRARPAGPDLAHVNKVLALLLAEVQRGYASGVFDESYDREFSLLHGLDFQPAFIALRAIRGIRSLGNDALPVQLGGMFKHLLPIADEMFGKQHREFDVVLAEQV